MKLDLPRKFSSLTVVLHWVVAIVTVLLLAMGIYMSEWDVYALYPIHKSFGIIIFVFVLARVAWRIKNGWPVPASSYKAWEQTLAKVVHWILILGTICMPASGMLSSLAGGRGLYVFGLELVGNNPDPAAPDNPFAVVPLSEPLDAFGSLVHHWVGFLLVVAVLLHIGAALKHHVIDKDGALRRMLGQRI